MLEIEFREIKFRAFDTENKTWTFVTLGDLVCGACTENGDKPLSGAKQDWEQYTGLKDKNGKEIYEGDIVKNIDSKLGDVGVIKFSEKLARYSVYWGMNPCMAKEIKLDGMFIVGNIHENPELLEKE